MGIHNKSDEPFPESEQDQAFLDLMTRFYLSNRSRYEEQAKKLLREGQLVVPLGGSLLKYSLKDGQSRYKVSEDDGLTFSNPLQVMPLPRRKQARIERLIEQFAHSEAREALGI